MYFTTLKLVLLLFLVTVGESADFCQSLVDKNGAIDFGISVTNKPFIFIFMDNDYWKFTRLAESNYFEIDSQSGEENVWFNSKNNFKFLFVLENPSNNLNTIRYYDQSKGEIKWGKIASNEHLKPISTKPEFTKFDLKEFKFSIGYQTSHFSSRSSHSILFVEQIQDLSNNVFNRSVQLRHFMDLLKPVYESHVYKANFLKFIKEFDTSLKVSSLYGIRVDNNDGVVITFHYNNTQMHCITNEEPFDDMCKPRNPKLLFDCSGYSKSIDNSNDNDIDNSSDSNIKAVTTNSIGSDFISIIPIVCVLAIIIANFIIMMNCYNKSITRREQLLPKV